ncbi:zinc-binding dehydrogenase, partial [Streptococcus pyogenes]
ATRMGASQTINVMTQPEALEPFKADKGHFNVAFECSAAAPALRTAIECVRPRGRIVQVGVTGDLPIPVNLIVGKEIEFVGTHR